MSEAATDLVVDQPQTEVQTPQVDTYESSAREQGWKPKEEFEGDPDKWRPAKEFVERGELFSKMDNMGKELKETKKALKMLAEHTARVKETEYNRAVQELKALQKRHLEEGRSDEYLQTTELLTDLKAEQKARQVAFEVQAQQQPQGVDPQFVAWTQKNSWYNSDAEMRKYADNIGLGYAKANPDIDPNDVLKYVAGEVKIRFKDKFENPNRTKPSAVEGASSPGGGKREGGVQLTDEERRVMNTFIRTGVMTKEEYIAQVKAMKGVK